MSIFPPSRNLWVAAQGPTLAELQARLDSDVSLPKRRRQDLQSALRTVAKAFGKPLDELPAQPDKLRACLNGFVPSMAGLSKRRWLNALSLTRSAMTQFGLISIPARSNTPMTPLWNARFALIDQHSAAGTLPQGKRVRTALSRFAHYCSARDIEPEAVDDTVFDNFLADVTRGALIKQPRETHRKATIVDRR